MDISELLREFPRYQEIQPIGRGAFGYVAQARDSETGGHVALKIMGRGPLISKYQEREIVNQSLLRHPHIIDLQEVFLTPDYLVLVMEYGGGGDLHQRMRKARVLSEDDARWFFQQIALAVEFCHLMGVANRDIKLANCVLHDNSPRPLVKLADFGLSKDENCHSNPKTLVGTAAYQAPEVITSGREGSTYDGKKADVWSCGVLLYVMLTGRYPFQRCEDTKCNPMHRVESMTSRILNVSYKFPSEPKLSEMVKELISKMLVADPRERPTMQAVLHHPWTCDGLPPSVLDFNKHILEGIQPRPQEVVEGIQRLVLEAQQTPRGQLAPDLEEPGPGSDEKIEEDLGIILDPVEPFFPE